MSEFENIVFKSKKNLTKKSLDLFECLMDKMKNIDYDEIDIQFEENKDFVRVSLTSESNDRISFYVDIYSGYCDFFIDNGKEVFIQYEFKSIIEADDFFEEFLESPIKYVKAETKKGKVWKEKYILVSPKERILIGGEIGIRFQLVNESKLIESERKFTPWIKK